MLKFEEETGKILNACIEVHNELGNGFLVIVELKAAVGLVKAHKAQVLNYLKAVKADVGLLVNFGENSLKWERITRFEKE